MAAESNVGARIFLIGKDAALAGLKEVQAAVARLNADIAAGATASGTAAAGYTEQAAGLEALQAKMALYETQLATVNAETDSVARLGKVAFLGLTAAAGAFGYESIKWARDYQTQLVRLQTQAGLTASAVGAVGTAAMRNAANLGMGPATYVAMAYHPASAGFRTKTSIRITNAAGMLAGIGGAPGETTVNAVTGIMRSYNYKGNQAKRVAALINATIGAGNMRMPTFLAAAGSGVYASGKTFGASAASVGSALAFMTDRGVPASQAGTRLRMTLSLLGAPSAKAATLLKTAGMTTAQAQKTSNALSQMLQAQGVTVTELSKALRTNKGGGGIYNAMEILHKHLSGMSPEMQGATISRSFGGGRMGTTVEMLYNSLPTLARKGKYIAGHGSTQTLMKDWGKYTQTLTYAMKRFDGTIKTLGTSLGEKLIPPLTKVLNMFSSMLKWLDKNKAVAIAFGTAISAVLVPAIGVYLYRALLSSGGAIRTVISGYGNLLKGNNAEQLALQRTNALLADNAGATDALAGADVRLGGAASAAAGRIGAEDAALAGGGAGGLGGLGGVGRVGEGGFFAGAGSKLLTAGMYAGGGILAGSMLRGKSGTTVTGTEKGMAVLRTVGGDVVEGAGIGASVGSFIPGVGTVIGAGAGALGGAIYAERNQIGHAAKGLWDDVFGGGESGTHMTAAEKLNRSIDQRLARNPNQSIHIYIDGKEVTYSVQKHIKKTAARSS